MALTIDIDPHGYARVPFIELRTRLLALDKTFSEHELRKLPYNELVLAAIANAGKAACSIDEVVAEKERRRYRFLHMSPDEYPQAKRYLQVEGMYSDLDALLEMRAAPTWDELSPRVRLWCKLNCLYTHCDNPDQRLQDAYPLVLDCDQRGLLRPGFAERLTSDLDRLRWLYGDAFGEDEFHYISGCLAEELLTQLDDSEKRDCERELVADYVCTGNCYHATGADD